MLLSKDSGFSEKNGENLTNNADNRDDQSKSKIHALPLLPLNLSGNRERSTFPAIHAMSESSRNRMNTNTSTKAAVIRNLIMSTPPSDTKSITQILQLEIVQANQIRLTIAVALGG